MSQLGKSNLNLNLNLNLGVGGGSGAGGGRGLRFNGQEFRKLIDRGRFPFRSDSHEKIADLGRGAGERIRFRNYWDGELKSYIYVNEFVSELCKENRNWLTELITELTPAEELLKKHIDSQLVAVLDAAPDRESRFAEILFQDSAQGALSYWFGMLNIDPGSHPATCLLVHAARRIGELVVMCLKNEFRFPRPPQLCPAIVPMVDPPVTPSFPAGHALQSYLISFCLQVVLREERRDPDGKPIQVETVPQSTLLLEELADRVALNRIIAGIHYPLDNEAGKAAAAWCAERLLPLPLFGALVAEAQKEVRPKGEAESMARHPVKEAKQ
jgi:membrane-associated phospholipid phosphatase